MVKRGNSKEIRRINCYFRLYPLDFIRMSLRLSKYEIKDGFMNKNRIEDEKNVLYRMVYIYCKGKKHSEHLCGNCKELVEYANQRLVACRFGENKSFCSKCTVHCFKPEMREKIKAVMKYSGPRMMLHNPIMAIKHLIQK